MVKNMTGGNKAKGQARKNFAPRTEALRLPLVSDERLARVLKLFGGGRASVCLPCGLEMVCVIRKKFRGRLKRNNCLLVDGLVLVGLREWECPSYKTCDLLEVYAHEDSSRLSSALPTAFAALAVLSGDTSLFDADALFSYEESGIEVDAIESKSCVSGSALDVNEDVCWDDI